MAIIRNSQHYQVFSFSDDCISKDKKGIATINVSKAEHELILRLLRQVTKAHNKSFELAQRRLSEATTEEEHNKAESAMIYNADVRDQLKSIGMLISGITPTKTEVKAEDDSEYDCGF